MKKILISLLAAIIAVGTAMAADQVFTWTYNTKTVSITGNLKTEGTIVLTGTEGEAETTTTTAKDVTFAFMADKDCVVGKYGSAPKGIALGGNANKKAYFADLVSLSTTDFKGQLIKGISFTQKFSKANSSDKIIIKIDGTQVSEIAGSATASTVKYENADGVLCNENISIEYHFPENNSTVIGYFSETISITYSEETGPVDAKPQFENIDIVYNPNEPNLKPVVTTPANFLADCANLTYTIEPANVIDIDNDLKILAPVENATMTATWKANDKYNEGSTTFTVTVKKNENPGLEYSATTASVTLGEKYELPTFTNTYGLSVEYTSSDTNVAEINAEGVVTPKAKGETVIKATFKGDELIAGDEASYILTVEPEKELEAPTFSIDGVGAIADKGTCDYGSKLVISTTAADATLEYSTDAENYLPYTGPITLNKAGEWTVFARVTKGGKTAEDCISFTVNKLKYTYEFGEVAEQMVGRDRYFTMPALVGVEGLAVKYEPIYDEGVLLEVPGQEGKYFITGAGEVIVTAEIAGDDTHNDFTAETTVKVVPQVATIETTNVFDYQNYKTIGLSDPADGQYIYIADNEEIKVGNVVMTTVQGSGTTPSRIVVNNDASKTYFAIYRPTTTNGKGGSMTFTGSDIVKIEITFLSYPNVVVAETEGTFTDAVDNVRVWTPKEGSVNSATFYTTFSGDKNQKWNPQIAKVVVYTMSEGGEPAQTFDMTFSAKEYELEEGDLMPNVVLPDDFTGKVKYLVDGEPVAADYRFPTEDAYEVIAYTEGDTKRLPAVAKAAVFANGYELESYLTIHYSTDEGMHYANCQTVTGTEGRYKFEDIEVKGYDGVDGKFYGHVFFSFYQAAAETPALAPRREAAEADWASFNAANVIYTPEEHLAMAGANTTLVRNRANTLGETMPALLRVPASNDTQKALNFTVQLDKLGTSNVTVSEGTQTGVESVGVDADGEAEYYTLQGVRVAKPAAGIYLRRQGGTVSKVLVK